MEKNSRYIALSDVVPRAYPLVRPSRRAPLQLWARRVAREITIFDSPEAIDIQQRKHPLLMRYNARLLHERVLVFNVVARLVDVLQAGRGAKRGSKGGAMLEHETPACPDGWRLHCGDCVWCISSNGILFFSRRGRRSWLPGCVVLPLSRPGGKN